MWYAVIISLLRRRAVLTVIFLVSLTYCLLSLLTTDGSLSIDFDVDSQYAIKRLEPLIWQPKNFNTNFTNCRNSIQGKDLIVDERGFICSRTDLLQQSTGCCNVDSNTTQQYSCESCNNTVDCCAIYEYCVSCCLNPEKKELLETVIAKATGRQVTVFATVKDQFELCLSKCRTSSHSVEHENKYRDSNLKHCYGLTDVHESQREVIPLK